MEDDLKYWRQVAAAIVRENAVDHPSVIFARSKWCEELCSFLNIDAASIVLKVTKSCSCWLCEEELKVCIRKQINSEKKEKCKRSPKKKAA